MLEGQIARRAPHNRVHHQIVGPTNQITPSETIPIDTP
jgi:hypothetical protein